MIQLHLKCSCVTFFQDKSTDKAILTVRTTMFSTESRCENDAEGGAVNWLGKREGAAASTAHAVGLIPTTSPSTGVAAALGAGEVVTSFAFAVYVVGRTLGGPNVGLADGMVVVEGNEDDSVEGFVERPPLVGKRVSGCFTGRVAGVLVIAAGEDMVEDGRPFRSSIKPDT
jgi:hypothetical protein